MIGVEHKKNHIKWYRLAQQAVNDVSIIPNRFCKLVGSCNFIMK